jgi:hypothetical protein
MASASGSSGQSLATARSPKSCCPLEPGPLTGSRHERTFARLSIGASVRSFFTGSRPRLRRGGAGPRDGAPRCGRRWRAVLAHPTAPRAHAEEQRPGPVPGRCSQLRRSSPSTALMTAGAGACPAAASPSPHHDQESNPQTRWADLRTGIAAGNLPAEQARGHCADPRGGPRPQPITLPHALSPRRTETSATCRDQARRIRAQKHDQDQDPKSPKRPGRQTGG